MRLIDADVLFEEAFKIWGTEADGGETSLFMEMINSAPTITLSPNDPLTLEELLEMDGEQVWCVIDYTTLVNNKIEYTTHYEEWGIISSSGSLDDENFIIGTAHIHYFDNYGDTFVAYRYKKDEETK